MLRFAPFYKPAPWGGTRLRTKLGRRTNVEPCGEAWELVEIDGHHSRVAHGPLEGKELGELWRQGLLGGTATGRFPFLVKWLDTKDKLSVQVHPDADTAAKLDGCLPKSEAWYVADASPDAQILLGHYPGLDAATLRTAAQGGTIQKWLYDVRPRQ